MFIVIKLANCSVLVLNEVVGDSVHYFQNTPIATPTSWPDHLKCACYGPALVKSYASCILYLFKISRESYSNTLLVSPFMCDTYICVAFHIV